jgi:hypothetical protein
MAFILGVASPEEISRIRKAGYEIDEVLTEDKERALWGQSRKDQNEDDDDVMIMLYVDCDIPDLLDMKGI